MKYKLLIIFFILLSTPMSGYSSFYTQINDTFVIDDFEDNTIDQDPAWWRFGDLMTATVENNLNLKKGLGYLSLNISGQTENWTIGGLGTYFGIDASKYNAIKLHVKGSSEYPGTVVIELYDDDNSNWQIETHPDNPSKLLFDDKFIYTLQVSWDGWKVIQIPFSKFIDENPSIGDDIWNPNQKDSSGGLLQMQLILIGAKPKSSIKMDIDNIKLYRSK